MEIDQQTTQQRLEEMELTFNKLFLTYQNEKRRKPQPFPNALRIMEAELTEKRNQINLLKDELASISE